MVIDQAQGTVLRAFHIIKLDDIVGNNVDSVPG